MNSVKKQAVPKYYQISQELVAKIRKGDWITGDQILSENEIIEKYKVSNTTARKALHEIEEAGWVRRIKGRGTFVCNNSVDRSISRILSFTKNMLAAGRKPSTKLLRVDKCLSNHSTAIQGRQYILEGPLYRVQRLRFANDIPVMKETRYISATFCPGIETMNLEGSLYEIYKREYGIDLKRINQILSAIMLDEKTSEMFSLEKPVPAFCVHGVTFWGKELIVEMEESIYRGDIYRFSVEAT